MNKRVFGADLLLLLTAAVWGFGFVAQSSGMLYVGPFAFNGLRFVLGSICLLPLIAWRAGGKPRISARERKNFLAASFVAGTCLFIAVTIQQMGMMFTSAGHAGFITGLYVILTPIFGLFLGRKTGPATWAGAALTITGLFFLSSGGRFDSVNPADLVIAVSAVFWAFHVLIIDRLVERIDPVSLSSGQFAVTGVYALAAAFLAEPALSTRLGTLGPEFHASGLTRWQSFPALLTGAAAGSLPGPVISGAAINILYGGLVSVGVGYTLQAVAQKNAPPAHATILLSLEGCFAVLGGALILGETLGIWTLAGCTLMLAGMLVSQWELIAGKK